MGAERARITILLVDDDVGVLRAVARRLRFAGYAVMTAQSAAEALGAGPADVGVFDIDLPGTSGVTVAVELFRRFRVTRLVFFTASADRRARARARLLGPLIDKAEGVAALLAALPHAAKRHRRPRRQEKP